MSDTLSCFASDFCQLPGKTGTQLTDGDFNRFALRLFRLQHANNPDYQALCNARGVDAEAMEQWFDIPAVPTSAFKQAAFSCLPVERRATVFESSGTTAAVRSRHHHSAESLEVYEASLLHWFRQHLMPEMSPNLRGIEGKQVLHGRMRPWFLSLTPAPASAPRSSLVHMLGCVSRQPWFEKNTFAGAIESGGAWRVHPECVLAFLHAAIDAGAPVVLTGTAFNFVDWLDALEVRNASLRLPPGSRVMETGGYKGRTRSLAKPELHAWISRLLAVRRDHIVTEYGMTELSSQAYDGVVGEPGSRDYLRFPPWSRPRVISVETGNDAAQAEVGLLRIVDLANVFSVLAVETEDLAVYDGMGVQLIGRNPGAESRGCSLHSVPQLRTAPMALAR